MASPEIGRIQLGMSLPTIPAVLAGKKLTFSIEVKGHIERVGDPGLGVLGVVTLTGKGKSQGIQLSPKSPPRVDGNEAALPKVTGDLDWTTLSATFVLPQETASFQALLYLHQAAGNLEWRNPELKLAAEGAAITAVVPERLASTEAEVQAALKTWETNYRLRLDELGAPPASEIWKPKPALSAKHPRYMFAGTPLAELQKRIKDPQFARYRDELFAVARDISNMSPTETPSFHSAMFAHMGEYLPWLALAHLLTEDPAEKAQFLQAAQRWTEAVIAQGDHPDNLATANGLLGLAVVYDWLYNDWTPGFRAKLRQHIIDRARWARSPENLSSQQFRRAEAVGNQQWLANHRWFNFASVALASAVLWGDEEAPIQPGELQKWMDEAMLTYWVVLRTFDSDGAPVEGYMYMAYGDRPYFYFIPITEELTECSLPLMETVRPQAENMLHASLPASQGHFSYSDSFSYNPLNSSVAPCFRKIAAYFKDPQAQLLAERIENLTKEAANLGTPIKKDLRERLPEFNPLSWRSLFWYDPSVKTADVSSLPLFRDNTGLGTFNARSDWKDPKATFFGFIAGPATGESTAEVWGKSLANGHANPLQGAFQLYAGAIPVVPPVFYPKPKLTESYPVAVFEGRGSKAGKLQGQISEGKDWFMDDYKYIKSMGKTLDVRHEDGFHSYLAEIGGLYALEDERAKAPMFPSYRRSITYFPKGVVVIADRIRTDLPRRAQFRIPLATENLKIEGQGFDFTSGNVKGRLSNFSPQPVELAVSSEKIAGFPRMVAVLKGPDATEVIFAAVLGVNGAEAGYSVKADAQSLVITRPDGKPVTLSWRDDLIVPDAKGFREGGFRGLKHWTEKSAH
ncbi:MAG: hypothetical protein WCH98_08140 [Verrucomicrobiota bacterium]